MKLTESKIYNPDLLYHCVDAKGFYPMEDNLHKLFSEKGLRINDNGEANGIWFNSEEPYYKNGSLILSLPDTEENRVKYQIRDNIAHIDIPLSELTFERFPIGYTNGRLVTDETLDFIFDNILKRRKETFRHLHVRNFLNDYVYFKDVIEKLYHRKVDFDSLSDLPNVKLKEVL